MNLQLLNLLAALAATPLILVSGTSPEDIGTLIVGGEPVSEEELPYQISVQRGGGHQGGGSLLVVNGTQVIITSAQTVTPGNASFYTVVAGELLRSIFSGHEQRRQPVKRVIHEDFYVTTNDIALFFLDQPFDLNEWVQPIPLPVQGQRTTGDVLYSGWGNLVSLGRRADALHKVQVPVIEDVVCEEIYGGGGGTDNPDMTMCAGWMGGGKGICHADLGGPVAAINGGYLAGVISGASDAICALRDRPNINMEVSHFVNWINRQVAQYKLESELVTVSKN